MDIKRRFAEHKRELEANVHPNKKMQNSYNKYGCLAFKYDVIEVLKAEITQEYINERECFWIEALGSSVLKNGFNIAEGGSNGNTLANLSEEKLKERIRKISEKQRGKIVSEETRVKQSEAKKGKPSWNKGKNLSEEHRSNLSKNHADVSGENSPMYGKKHSAETRKKISEKLSTKEVSDKIRKSKRGGNNPQSKSVVCIETGEVYETITSAARKTGANRCSISLVCQNKQSSAGGLKFAYYEDYIGKKHPDGCSLCLKGGE